jgi:hypothetical protein
LEAAARLRPSVELLSLIDKHLKDPDLLSGETGIAAVAMIGESATDPQLRSKTVSVCSAYLTRQADHQWIDGNTSRALEMIGKAIPPDEARVELSKIIAETRWVLLKDEAQRILEELEVRDGPGQMQNPVAHGQGVGRAVPGERRITAAACARICVERKLLSQEEVDAALREMQRSGETEQEVRQTVAGLFSCAGRFLTFDVEVGMIPARHDRLLQQFAEASAGKFKPEAMLEDFDGRENVPDGGVYAVQFVHAERLYRFFPRNLGDWYDVTAVAAAVDRALADAGTTERFVPFFPNGQYAAFVFGDPDVVRTMAAGLGFQLGDNLDEAHAIGIEAENRMRNALEKAEKKGD